MTIPTVIVPYSDTNQDKRLMLYVSLQFCTRPKYLDTKVSTSGIKLVIKQTRPELLLNPKRLLSRHMIKYGRHGYDPKHIVVTNFCSSIRKFKIKSSNQVLASTYCILLPFVVENRLVEPPSCKHPCFELLRFGANREMCVHLCEVRTSYN